METIPSLDDFGCKGHDEGTEQSTEGGADDARRFRLRSSAAGEEQEVRTTRGRGRRCEEGRDNTAWIWGRWTRDGRAPALGLYAARAARARGSYAGTTQHRGREIRGEGGGAHSAGRGEACSYVRCGWGRGKARCLELEKSGRFEEASCPV
jgi:hypothetical protein